MSDEPTILVDYVRKNYRSLASVTLPEELEKVIMLGAPLVSVLDAMAYLIEEQQRRIDSLEFKIARIRDGFHTMGSNF